MKKRQGKLFKWYVGMYAEEKDEYQLGKIYEILARGNMWGFLLTTVAMLASFVWDTLHHQFSLGTILLFLLAQFNAFYSLQKSHKYQLQNKEVYSKETYEQTIKKVKKQGVLSGLCYGSLMYMWMEYFLPFLKGEPLSFRGGKLITWLVAGAFFGLIMYGVTKSQVKQVEDKE